MNKNHNDHSSTHLHYSLTSKDSLGIKYEYRNDYSSNNYLFQYNRLLKRFNKENSQTNIYLKNAIGLIDYQEDQMFSSFSEIAFDYETRNFFTSYNASYSYGKQVYDFFEQRARVGISPINAKYGDLTWWFMVEAMNQPEADDNFTLVPLVRLFKRTFLIELGSDFKENFLINFIKRY